VANTTNITKAGAQGGSFQSYSFTVPGNYLVTGRYQHFEVPDTTIIKLGSQTIYSSGTLVSGSDRFVESFAVKAGETATLSFIVDAPIAGTAWNYNATITHTEPKPPVARDDSGAKFRVTEDKPLHIGAPELVANDSDPDDDIDIRTFTIVGQPAHGTLTSDNGGVQSLTYTPDFEALKLAGRDSFTYTISDAGGRVSNTATVFIEGPCSPPYPYTISGGTVEELGGGKCRMTGNFFLGRADGTERLVFVQNGVAEYDRDRLEILSGTFSSAVGPEPIALFTLTETLTFLRDQTSAVDLVLPTQGDVALGGLPFKVASIALDRTEIDLGGALVLPAAVGGQELLFGTFNSIGGAPFGAKITALSIGPQGVSVESGEIALKDRNFKAFDLIEVKSEGIKVTFADNLSSALPDLALNGKLSITQEVFNTGKNAAGEDQDSIGKRGFFIDLLPPQNGVKIAEGKLDDARATLGSVGRLEADGGWSIADVTGTVEFTDGALSGFRAGAKIGFPEIKLLKGGIDGIEGDLGFVVRRDDFLLDDLKVRINGDIPIGTTGWFLTALGGGFENIQPNAVGGDGFNRPLILNAVVGLGLGPSVTVGPLDPLIAPAGEIEFRTFEIELDGALREERAADGLARKGDLSITAAAKASLLAPEILTGTAKGSINFSQGLADISEAKITAFGGIFNGAGSLGASIASGKASAKVTGQIKVPDLPAFFSYRGATLTESQLEGYAVGDSFAVQAWQSVAIGNIGALDIGFRYDSANGFKPVFGTKPALLVGSWQTEGNEDWLEMTASWENPAGRDVALRVTYQAVVGGPVLATYEEADFEAAGIVAPLDFSGDYARSVFVNDPRAGVWDVAVVDATGLGAVAHDGFVPTDRPEIVLLGATLLAGTPGVPAYEIRYEAFDPDSVADIVFFVDDDGEGHDGTPMGVAGLVFEADGTGTVTFSTADFPAGAQYVYAMIADGDSAPVFSGYLGALQGRAATDLALDARGPGDEIHEGSWASYTFTIDNLGTETALDGVLALQFSDLAFLPKAPGPVDPRDGSLFDTMDWRVLGAGAGMTPLGWSRLDTYATGANGTVIATPDGDWVFSVGLAPLAAGASRTLDIQFRAPDAGTQVLSLQAAVSSAGWETDVSNDAASLVTSVVARQAEAADLSLTRIAPDQGPDPAANGQHDYAYVITNNSLSRADGVTLTIALGPELPLPQGLRDFYYSPGSLFASTQGFAATDESAPWSTQQQPYLYTVTLDRPLEGGESIVVPMIYRPAYHWTFDETATVSHAGLDTDTSNNVATGLLDLPPFERAPPAPPSASVRIEADDYTPAVGDEILVTARFGVTDDTGGQLFRVTLPAGVELLSSRTVITIGTTVTDRPVSSEVSFTPDPENPGSYLWQVADINGSAGRSLELNLRVLDASPQPISIEMIASPLPFANATPGNGLIGEADDATLTLNDPEGPPPPPDIGITTPPFVNLLGYIFDNPLPEIVEGRFFSYTFGPEAFLAADEGEPLTISLDSGPAWLSFDPDTLTISGIPDVPNQPSLRLRATDAEGDTSTDTVRLRVTNTPDAPEIARQIADQTAKVGTPFALRTPNPQDVGMRDTFDTIGIFGDPDYRAWEARTLVGDDVVPGRDVLTLSFSGLPDWLALDDSDPQMPLLRGVPFADDVGSTTVTITATDIFGLSATMTFDVEVVANDNPANGFLVSAGSGIVTEGDSGTTLAAITIARFGDATGPASVAWAVAGAGDAPADGRDFGGRLPSGVAEFAAGEMVRTIELRVRGDLLAEDDEGFEVVLSNAVGAPIALDRVRVQILNDDAVPQPGEASDAATTVGFRSAFDAAFFPFPFFEGDEGITYEVVELERQGDLRAATTVAWRLDHFETDAADFGGITPRGVAVFEPGQSTAQIRLPVSGDTVAETLGQAYDYYPDFGEFGAYFPEGYSPDDLEFDPSIPYFAPFDSPFFEETFALVIESAEGARIVGGDFRGVIANDDPMFTLDTFSAEVRLIDPAPTMPGGAEGTTFTFEVTTQDLGTFTFEAAIAWDILGLGAAPADAADFAPAVLASGIAEFGPGNISTTISVEVAADGIGEDVEQFAVVLRPFDPASTLFTTAGAAIATILNAEYGLRDDAATTPAGEAVAIDLIGNDIAPPGGGLTLVALGTAAHGTVTFGAAGAAVYTPDPGFSGTDGFTYTARGADGATRSAHVTVTVASPVEAVDARNDTAATQAGMAVEVDVLANDIAPGGAALSVVHFGYAGSGEVALSGAGLLRYTPAAGFSGIDVIRYSSGDGITEDSATLTVSVGNHAPRLDIDRREASVGDRAPVVPLRVADILLGDGGIGEHVFTLSGPDAALFELTGQSLSLRAGAALEGRAGQTLSVGILVDDTLLPGGVDDAATFTLDIVRATNTAPFANDDLFRARGDGPQVFDLVANDRDFDDDAITLISVAGATQGTAEIMDGRLVYTPFAGVLSEDRLTYRITDGREIASGEARIWRATGIADPDRPIFGTGEPDALVGTATADTIHGLGGADTLSALAGDDMLLGGDGADRMVGGPGADTLQGEGGNDRYIVDQLGLVAEEPDQGVDSVVSHGSWVLAPHVENLRFLGTADVNGTGNANGSRIQGNDGNNLLQGLQGNDNLLGGIGADTLRGGPGDDRLVGGPGADRFHFAGPNQGLDRIIDFVSGEDIIALSAVAFGFLPGSLPETQFVSHAANSATAPAGTPQIIHNARTGHLLFDADGSATGSAPLAFAKLAAQSEAPALADFLFV
jgi:Ca2+-binding RTX toxin-like protein